MLNKKHNLKSGKKTKIKNGIKKGQATKKGLMTKCIIICWCCSFHETKAKKHKTKARDKNKEPKKTKKKDKKEGEKKNEGETEKEKVKKGEAKKGQRETKDFLGGKAVLAMKSKEKGEKNKTNKKNK